MSKLIHAVPAALLIAAALTLPAVAAPPQITVHPNAPVYLLPDSIGNGGADWGDNGFAGDPLSQNYDPAGATPDWHYYGPPAVDIVLARTLDRTGESMLGHILKCQAHYPTYSASSNTYFGRHGIPAACQL